MPIDPVEHRATVRALVLTAQRVLAARQLEMELCQLVTVVAPALLTQPGIGPIGAAQVLISWSHPGRFRSEAAFAMLAGAARASARSVAASSAPLLASCTDCWSARPPSQPAVDAK
jgi:transposase